MTDPIPAATDPGGAAWGVTAVVAYPDAEVRGAIMAALDGDGIEVLGDAADGASAYALVLAVAPDVAVLAAGLPGIDGVTLCARLHAEMPACRVLLCHSHDGDEAASGLEAGAAGSLIAGAMTLPWATAVRAAARGHAVPSPAGAAWIRARSVELDRPLTADEHEVVDVLAAGATLDEVARVLDRPAATVGRLAGNALARVVALTVSDPAGLTGLTVFEPEPDWEPAAVAPIPPAAAAPAATPAPAPGPATRPQRTRNRSSWRR